MNGVEKSSPLKAQVSVYSRPRPFRVAYLVEESEHWPEIPNGSIRGVVWTLGRPTNSICPGPQWGGHLGLLGLAALVGPRPRLFLCSAEQNVGPADRRAKSAHVVLSPQNITAQSRTRSIPDRALMFEASRLLAFSLFCACRGVS